MSTAVSNRSKTECGATLVEAALALPILIAFAILVVGLAELTVSHLLIRDNMRQATRSAARVQPDGVTAIDSLRRDRLISELGNLERFGVHVESQQINNVSEGFYFTVEFSNTCRLCKIFGIGSREVFSSALFPRS